MPIKTERRLYEIFGEKLKNVCTLLLALIMALTPIGPVSATGNPYAGGWSNCTWGAWQALYQATGVALPGLGNACDWLWRAQSLGYSTGLAPAAGSIAVYTNHVAYVSEVSADQSSVYIIEGGFNGGYNERWVSSSAIYGQALQGYIYTGAAPTAPVQAPVYTEPVYVPPVQQTYTAAPAYTYVQPVQVQTAEPEPEPEEEVIEFDPSKPNTDLLPGIIIYTDDISEDVLSEGRESISFSETKTLTTAASDKTAEATSLRSINSTLNTTKIEFGERSLLEPIAAEPERVPNDKTSEQK